VLVQQKGGLLQTTQELPTSEYFDLHQLAEGVYAAIAIEGGAAFSNAGIVDLGGGSPTVDVR